MAVPLLDLKAQWEQVGEEVLAALKEIFTSARYIMGPPVAQFEDEVAAYCGCRHAVGCASGSDAIVLALLALEIGPGDEVIVPAFTFFATAGAVSRVGATPVFADNDPVSYNILPGEIERLATPRTKAAVPVHLFGQVAEMDAIVETCRPRGIRIIEDAAQSIGAKYKGRRTGQTGGDVATLSFFPSKNLGCLGDGGMCLTNDEGLAERLRILRLHGAKPKYQHKLIGVNSRLDSLQAAALSVKLKYLEGWHEGRRRNAADYDAKLAGVPGIETPSIAEHCESIYNQYTIRIKDGKRDMVRDGLKERGIGCEVYYPIPLHLQECYAGLGGKSGDLPGAEEAAQEVLSIPVYPELSEEQRDEVVGALKALVGQGVTASSTH
ncbi:DegT/DnrJ/EryC1/StrS family aminotransferase [bacterium]|nr:DegT/DnrJ/EryC1/StrS family aminotransferase [bacterium]